MPACRPVSSDRALARVRIRSLGALGLLLLCLCMAGPAAWAQGAAAPAQKPDAPRASAALPTAAEVLARYRKAIGGDAAITGHTSRRVSGRFEMPAQGMSGPLELLAAAPNKTRMRIELAGLGTVERGFDGHVGWAVDPAIGPRLLVGRELDEMKHTADFYYDLRLPESGVTMTVVERAPFEGRECYTVRVVRASGFEVLEYYDVETGLAAGYRMSSTSPMGTVPSVVTVVNEYKPFGPLLMPTVMQQRAMGIDSVLRITEVAYDTVPADAFALPPAIKALVK
jgi:hypothetical protein